MVDTSLFFFIFIIYLRNKKYGLKCNELFCKTLMKRTNGQIMMFANIGCIAT